MLDLRLVGQFVNGFNVEKASLYDLDFISYVNSDIIKVKNEIKQKQIGIV